MPSPKIVPVVWKPERRTNGSYEIRHNGKLVAVISRDHPDLAGNLAAIAGAPAMLAGIMNLTDAWRARSSTAADRVDRDVENHQLALERRATVRDLVEIGGRIFDSADGMRAGPGKRARRKGHT